jgi:hypothetical protein
MIWLTRSRLRWWSGLCVLAAVLGACDGEEGGEAAQDATSTSTTAAPSPATDAPASGESDAAEACPTPESSPAQFDPKGGQYAVYLTGLDLARRTVAFDVIQFLGGESARKAYERDNPGDSGGPPNDYYIVNDNPAVREAAVSQSVRVVVVNLDSSSGQRAGEFDALPAHLARSKPSEGNQLSSFPYWLTVADGTVTEICQQYVP